MAMNGHREPVGDLHYPSGSIEPVYREDHFRAKLPDALPDDPNKHPGEDFLKALGKRAIIGAQKGGLIIHTENPPDPQYPGTAGQMDPPIYVGSSELPRDGLPLSVQQIGKPDLGESDESEPEVWADDVLYIPR